MNLQKYFIRLLQGATQQFSKFLEATWRSRPHRRKAAASFFCFLLSLLFVLGCNAVPTLSDRSPSLASESLDLDNRLRAGNVSEAVVELESNWETQYEDYFGEDFANLSMTAEEMAQKLSQVSDRIGKNPAVLWAVPQSDRLLLMLLTPGQQATRIASEVSQEQLLKVAQQFHRNVIRPRGAAQTYLAPAQQLYQWIIAPVAAELEAASIDTLLFCVGPGLRSLPFAALHDGRQFLIENYSVARIPAFNLTDTDFTGIRNAKVLAMGASEFTDQNPLPGVAVELSTITPQPWQGKALLNQEFTVSNLQGQRQQQEFGIVHLATHAEFKAGSPGNSYIQFSDGRVGLDRLQQLDLHEPPVELLVLSACKTAVGDREAELGFAGFAVQSGVKSAIASLWYVSDLGTLALMSEFYQQLKTLPLKAEALRQAQIAMLNGKLRIEQGQLRTSRGPVALPPALAEASEDLSHPFYWAAFSTIGSPW